MDELRARVADVEALYANQTCAASAALVRTRVRPSSIEFWHAGEYRLHERRRYERDGDGWTMRRLFP